MTTEKKPRRVILENMTHYLTALVIIIKGLDKIETPGKLWVSIVFLTIGVLIVLGTIFHHKAEKLLKHFKAYVFAFEAVVMAIVGYLYMKDGKQMIQYVCFAASLMFLVALVVYIKNRKRIQHA